MLSIGITSTDPAGFLSTVGKPDQLKQAQRDLQFLQGRPMHCDYLSGLFIENGLINPLNRGTFYSYKDAVGEIQGVALITSYADRTTRSSSGKPPTGDDND